MSIRASMTSGRVRPGPNAPDSAFSRPDTLSTRTPSQPSDSASSGMSVAVHRGRGQRVPDRGLVQLDPVEPAVGEHDDNQAEPEPGRPTDSSGAVIANPPSPVRADDRRARGR